jgi:hypothetical protein
MRNNKGFSSLVVVLLIILIVSIIGYFYLYPLVIKGNSTNTNPELTKNESENIENKIEIDPDSCASPEMFQLGPYTVIETLSDYERQLLGSKYTYANVISFNTYRADILWEYFSKDFRVFRFLRLDNPSDPLSPISLTYDFRVMPCVTAIQPYQFENNILIKTIFIDNAGVTIYEKPSPISSSNSAPKYYINIENQELEERAKGRYIEISPILYSKEIFEFKDIENVLRSVRFIN